MWGDGQGTTSEEHVGEDGFSLRNPTDFQVGPPSRQMIEGCEAQAGHFAMVFRYGVCVASGMNEIILPAGKEEGSWRAEDSGLCRDERD